MISCKQCGTELPEDARFCLQCGARVEQEPETGGHRPPLQEPPQGALPELDFVQPALTGGMFLGFLSSIPVISAGNCLCGMWVLLGGGIATVMLTKQRPSGIKYGDGAFAGVLSGLFGAVVGTIVQMSFRAMASRVFESEQQELERLWQQMGAPGPIPDWLLRALSGEISAVTVIITFIGNVLFYSLFAMIGGILAVAILEKRKRQPQKGTRGSE